MRNSELANDFELSIVVTVVGGKDLVRRLLTVLNHQLDLEIAEVIVPYDSLCVDVGDLAEEFSGIRFHYITDVGAASSGNITSRQHRLYDRRRAVGLSLARGRVVAMTEDYAVPAEDWCLQIRKAHEQPYAAIGGAIENGVDEPLNWALYYCDFGRYGRPLRSAEASYVSDVNISYKREALEAIRDVWRSVYHETTVNWTLRSNGQSLFLDSRLLVYEHRPRLTVSQAFREKIEWGRIFAETRIAKRSLSIRFLYAAGTLLLPTILTFRVFRTMLHRRGSAAHVVQTLPLAACLVAGTALGEFLGYLSGQPDSEVTLSEKASAI